MLGMPLQFEANQGQVDDQVKFLARGRGYTVFLTPTESVMVLSRQEVNAPIDDRIDEFMMSLTFVQPQQDGNAQVGDRTAGGPLLKMEQAPMKQSVVRMKLEGANPSPTVSGMEQLPGIVNYFTGNDPTKWRTKIPTYAKVHYQEAYPGIDLAYYGNQGKLEYDFIIAPGADPNQIKLAFEGVSDITVAESGDLLLTMALGDVRLQKPIVYQLEQDGHKTLVAGNYVLFPGSSALHASRTTSQEVGIQLAAYDRSKSLVIDPVVVYSTYLGGSNQEIGRGIAVDGAGAAYVTGTTSSLNFPVLSASQGASAGNGDAFVTKLDATGARVYSTYLGGSNLDNGNGIAVDGAGAAYVTGDTISLNFPVLSASQGALAGFIDAFVTKLDATGARVYSTYLGGSSQDIGRGIAVDGAGAAYVTGQTSSLNFPVLSASQGASAGNGDAFVTKLDATGARVYSTYLGGSNQDSGNGIAVDGAGSAYVTGRTFSLNFPVLSASQGASAGNGDAFVTKLDATGARVYSTYLGGSNQDSGNGIAVDGAGAAYVTGTTGSSNFPVLSASQAVYAGSGDAFITKLVEKPTANAGQDQSVPEGTLVTLDGTGSTAANPTYSWTQVAGPAASLANSGSAHPTFVAPNVPAAGGTDTFELVVCEGTSNNCSDPATVNVHITDVNHPPVAQAGEDQTVQEGSPVILDGTASYDPDIESLTYSWLQLFGPPVTLADANTATPSLTAPSVGTGGGQMDFELIVTDPHGANHSDFVSVFITNVNQPPVADAGLDQTKNENTLVTLDGSGSLDPDLDALSYSWSQTGGPGVSLTGANTVSPTFTAPNVAAGGAFLTFQLVVRDGQASSVADTVRIAVVNVNDPPVCSLAQASPNLLWPPNHTMTQVSIVGLTDPQNQTLTITYPKVTQDEPINGLGDGDTSPDAAESGNDILLRAERSGNGNGRVYVVQFTATNSDGDRCSGTVKVTVPHNKKDPAVEGSQLHNSFGP